MRIQIHLLILAIGFFRVAYSQEVASATPLSVSGGRFVFGQISSFRKDQFMLDTQTGRLWRMVTSTNDVEGLEMVPYLIPRGGYSLLPYAPEQSAANPSPNSAVRPQFEKSIIDAFTGWAAKMMESDPNFNRYADTVTARLESLWSVAPPSTVQNAIASAELVYKNVKAELDLQNPKKAVQTQQAVTASRPKNEH